MVFWPKMSQPSDIKRLKQQDAENRRFKQIYAELSLTSQIQQEIIIMLLCRRQFIRAAKSTTITILYNN